MKTEVPVLQKTFTVSGWLKGLRTFQGFSKVNYDLSNQWLSFLNKERIDTISHEMGTEWHAACRTKL